MSVEAVIRMLMLMLLMMNMMMRMMMRMLMLMMMQVIDSWLARVCITAPAAPFESHCTAAAAERGSLPRHQRHPPVLEGLDRLHAHRLQDPG